MTDIMHDLLKEFKLHKSQKRRRAIEKKLDYYTGTSTAQYIVERFSGDAFNEVPPYETNFTRKFVNKISRIYTLGAKRTTSGKTQTKLYESLIPTKDVRMKHSERMTSLNTDLFTLLSVILTKTPSLLRQSSTLYCIMFMMFPILWKTNGHTGIKALTR